MACGSFISYKDLNVDCKGTLLGATARESLRLEAFLEESPRLSVATPRLFRSFPSLSGSKAQLLVLGYSDNMLGWIVVSSGGI